MDQHTVAPPADAQTVAPIDTDAVKVKIARALGKSPAITCYSLAGTQFEFDLRLDVVSKFETSAVGTSAVAIEARGFGHLKPLFAAGVLGGRTQKIGVTPSVAGVILHIERLGRFVIDDRATAIELIELDGEPDMGLFIEALLGPVILLALAARGVWALHASAVRSRRGIVAIAGESGAGKSTLASYLDSVGLERVVDDILPLRAVNHTVEALPRYPQLKLAADAQPGIDGGPLGLIIILRKVNATEPVRLEKLDGVNLLKAIVHCGVATKLLPPRLLQSHFNFCTLVCNTLDVYEIPYAHMQSALESIPALLSLRD